MCAKIRMRDEWPALPVSKRKELEYLLHLLQKIMPYDRAILYGHYAGGNLRSVLGGYELLLVTCNPPMRDGWQIEKQLKHRFCEAIREEPNIHIETVAIAELNNLGPRSWLYFHIRNEGTILYDNFYAHNVFTNSGFRPTKAANELRERYGYFFRTGITMLAAAERSWEEKQPTVVAIQLSYAALLLLRAEESIYYDKPTRTTDLDVLYHRCLHYSPELVRAFPPDEKQHVNLFRELTFLRREPCRYTNYRLVATKYKGYLRRIRLLQKTVERSYERQLAALEQYSPQGKSQAQQSDAPVSAVGSSVVQEPCMVDAGAQQVEVQASVVKQFDAPVSAAVAKPENGVAAAAVD